MAPDGDDASPDRWPALERQRAHHTLGTEYDAARLGAAFLEELPEDKVV